MVPCVPRDQIFVCNASTYGTLSVLTAGEPSVTLFFPPFLPGANSV